MLLLLLLLLLLVLLLGFSCGYQRGLLVTVVCVCKGFRRSARYCFCCRSACFLLIISLSSYLSTRWDGDDHFHLDNVLFMHWSEWVDVFFCFHIFMHFPFVIFLFFERERDEKKSESFRSFLPFPPFASSWVISVMAVTVMGAAATARGVEWVRVGGVE